jgi:NAD(P)-dependent dehydrogenase (short-subunit alcohol dehydrogenase family)
VVRPFAAHARVPCDRTGTLDHIAPRLVAPSEHTPKWIIVSADTFPFADRTALVTGATNGLGLQIALRLALGGARVIVHGQTEQNTETAAAALAELGAPTGRLEQAVADFRHFDEVRALAGRLAEQHERIDLLVLNAGIAAPERRTLTDAGNELSFQVNYLAPYLLTRLLERSLTRGTDTRIVALGSTLHRTANIDWTDLTRSRRYSRIAAYGQSKLALTTFITALAHWLPAGHTALTVHPGIAETATRPLYGTIGRPAGEVAETVVRLCDPVFEVVNGGYYEKVDVAPAGTQVTDKRSIDRLLKLSERLTAQLEPAI